MGKQNTKRKGRLQTVLDREQIERDTAPLVNPFAEQHGDYERNLRFVVNRGGTQIDRWRREGTLSDSQLAGILHCQTLWSKLGNRSIVADFNRVRGYGHGEGYSQDEALSELCRISAAFPSEYWSAFENICRHDLPTGDAASRLAKNKASDLKKAQILVAFVADCIAFKERLSY